MLYDIRAERLRREVRSWEHLYCILAPQSSLQGLAARAALALLIKSLEHFRGPISDKILLNDLQLALLIPACVEDDDCNRQRTLFVVKEPLSYPHKAEPTAHQQGNGQKRFLVA